MAITKQTMGYQERTVATYTAASDDGDRLLTLSLGTANITNMFGGTPIILYEKNSTTPIATGFINSVSLTGDVEIFIGDETEYEAARDEYTATPLTNAAFNFAQSLQVPAAESWTIHYALKGNKPMGIYVTFVETGAEYKTLISGETAKPLAGNAWLQSSDYGGTSTLLVYDDGL